MDATAAPLDPAGSARAQMAQRQAQAWRSAKEFEAFFLTHFVSSMFEGLGTDPVFGGGPSEAIYRSMMAEEFGRIAARSGGVGIADAVHREMLRMQEIRTP